MTPAPPRSWRRRLLKLGLRLLLVLLAAEAALWIAFWVRRPEARVVVGEGSRTILCTGDSNTFGEHLAPEESYPGQLQGFLDRAPENPWRVVNVGYPGLNSAQVRRDLAGQIAEYRPELVICWVGTNNTWSSAAGQLWDTPDREEPASLGARVAQSMRLVKLGRMLVNQAAGGDDSRKVMSPARVRETLEIDLERIQAICAEGGARLMLADYPVHIESTEQNVNAVLRSVAARHGTPLVPLHDRVLPVVYGLGYDRTMFGDYHANRWGNHEVARQMLLAAIEAGVLEPRPEWLAVPPLAEVVPDWPIVVVSAAGERARVRLSGPAGSPYRIELGRRYTREHDKTDYESLKYGRAKDWSEDDLRERGLAGRLGPEGRAEVELTLPPDPPIPDPGNGRPVHWLGWELSVVYGEGEEAQPLPPKHTVLVLRDPAVVGSPSGG